MMICAHSHRLGRLTHQQVSSGPCLSDCIGFHLHRHTASVHGARIKDTVQRSSHLSAHEAVPSESSAKTVVLFDEPQQCD